jgi:hypothetical protein
MTSTFAVSLLPAPSIRTVIPGTNAVPWSMNG